MNMRLPLVNGWFGVLRGGLALAVLAGSAPCAFAAASPPAPSSASAAVDESLFKALQWRCIGPYRGGRALAVSGIPGDPDTFFFGAVAGGVWKTTDGGATWR